jgi:hypothetical protein
VEIKDQNSVNFFFFLSFRKLYQVPRVKYQGEGFLSSILRGILDQFLERFFKDFFTSFMSLHSCN